MKNKILICLLLALIPIPVFACVHSTNYFIGDSVTSVNYKLEAFASSLSSCDATYHNVSISSGNFNNSDIYIIAVGDGGGSGGGGNSGPPSLSLLPN